MSKPTLALIPSGYKRGKVYSILPNDATGDFDFTRQSIGTRVRKDGLIEEAKTVGSITNLQIRSEEFDNSAWIKSDISVTANDTLAPNGTNTADAIVEGTGTGGKIIYDTYTTSADVYTFSVHIKKEDKRYTAIQVSGSTATSMFNVDLDNGTGQVVAGSFDETNIETLANGWYRVSVTFTASSGTLNNQIYLMNGSAYANRNYTGNGTDKNYVWGAMVSEGALSDYIKTEGSQVTKTVETFTDVPRLDWLNSNCPSLKLEPQRTNLITYSEDFSQSVWNKSNCNVTLTSEVAPNGNANSVYNLTGTLANLYTSGSANIEHTISFYVKSNGQGKDKFKLRLGNNVSVEYTATNEWVRYEFTSTPTTSVFGITTTSAPNNEFDLLIWGAQLEQASYPTTYIKTEGSTVTRLADVCNNAGNSDLFNDAEGVLYAEIAALSDDLTFRSIALSDGTLDNRVLIRYRTTTNRINILIEASNVPVVNQNETLTDITNYSKFALKYKSGDIAFWIDGVEVFTDTTTFTISGLDRLNFDGGNGGDDFYGNCKDLRYYDTALTDAELTELTT